MSPIADRLTVRTSKQTTIDLTCAKLFVQNEGLHTDLVNLVSNHERSAKLIFNGQTVKIRLKVRILLTSLRWMHSIWSSKHLINDNDLSVYRSHLSRFMQAWTALTWKPTVWVHWIVAHSHFFPPKISLTVYIFLRSN